MTVKKLIEYLEAFLPDTKVYIDWDYEGNNEIEATDVVYFLDGEREGIKIT